MADNRRWGNDNGEAKDFGEQGGYWEKHNEITDKYDEDLLEKMNRELDNLLIFVRSRARR